MIALGVARGVQHREWRCRQAMVAHDALGYGLVERGRHGERIGEGIRLAEQFAERRHLRFARAAAKTLCNREHEIPAFPVCEALGEHLAASNAIDNMAEADERRLDFGDCGGRVELGDLQLGIAEREILVPQVVNEAYAHRRQAPGLAAAMSAGSIVRPAPTLPPGSR